MEQMSERRRSQLKELEGRMKVSFKDIRLLDTALTHTSYANERKQRVSNNERMEFLGDAVLELASSTYLFESFPLLSEGKLTRTRASIVCQDTLARLAETLGIGECLLLGHGEELCGGRERVTNLEDAFEAVIGAVYLDQGWEAAREYVLSQLKPEFAKAERGENLQDYKTLLQEMVQKDPNAVISYELLRESGPDHAKLFEVAVCINGSCLGEGRGHRKKEAEQRAAQIALKKITRLHE